MDRLTITLAGKEYEIQPLTIGQLEDLHIGILKIPSADPVEGGKEFWAQQLDTIVAALKVDHPEMTAEVIRKMRLGSLKDIKTQVNAILRYAGLIDVEPKAPAAGGAEPGEAPGAA